jgi:hypothetical protein
MFLGFCVLFIGTYVHGNLRGLGTSFHVTSYPPLRRELGTVNTKCKTGCGVPNLGGRLKQPCGSSNTVYSFF